MASKHTPAGTIALGGVLAALAVVVMSLGTLIPVATYVCPMMAALLLQVVLKTCGSRIACSCWEMWSFFCWTDCWECSRNGKAKGRNFPPLLR